MGPWHGWALANYILWYVIQYIHTTYIRVMCLGASFRTFAVLGSARIQFGVPSNSYLSHSCKDGCTTT